jgi:general secretion pathway protein F
MTVYRFEAVDADGQTREGVLDAGSPRQARDQLRARGLLPVKVRESHEDAAEINTARSRARLPASELTLLTRQLATLLVAGLPLEEALAACAAQTESERAKKLLAAIRSEVVAGHSLASTLARYPRAFPPLYRSLVAVGAETGQLAAVLARIADYLEAQQNLRQKVGLALLYPALVTLVAIGVITALMVYVVPQVVAAFAQTRQTLPLLTRGLILVSGALRVALPYVLVVLLLTAIAGRQALRRESLRYRWHAWQLRLPLAGRLLRGLDTARFASTLGILVASGAPLLRALEAAGAVMRLLPMRAAADEARRLIQQGLPLSRALAGRQAFPPVLIHLVASGEASGQLPQMLERAGAQQQAEVERRIAWLTGLLEPLLIIVMGGIVLLLVLAVMLPIVSMNQLIR